MAEFVTSITERQPCKCDIVSYAANDVSGPKKVAWAVQGKEGGDSIPWTGHTSTPIVAVV